MSQSSDNLESFLQFLARFEALAEPIVDAMEKVWDASELRRQECSWGSREGFGAYLTSLGEIFRLLPMAVRERILNDPLFWSGGLSKGDLRKPEWKTEVRWVRTLLLNERGLSIPSDQSFRLLANELQTLRRRLRGRIRNEFRSSQCQELIESIRVRMLVQKMADEQLRSLWQNIDDALKTWQGRIAFDVAQRTILGEPEGEDGGNPNDRKRRDRPKDANTPITLVAAELRRLEEQGICTPQAIVSHTARSEGARLRELIDAAKQYKPKRKGTGKPATDNSIIRAAKEHNRRLDTSQRHN